MQLLAKFKKILYMGFRATLNFRKFKVALNSMYRILLNFAKSGTLSCLSKYDVKKKFHRAGDSVAMVTYCVTKMIPTCSAGIGQFFDTMIVASRVVIMNHQNLCLGKF